MAILHNPKYDKYKGRINKNLVIRQYSDGRTVLSIYPDMSKVKPSAGQKEQRMSFKEAQAYAKQYLSDPANKAAYKDKCKPGQRPHNVLISELLKKEPLLVQEEKKIYVVTQKKILKNPQLKPEEGLVR